jgi:hypothetical protein
MSLARVQFFSVSLEGFGTGEGLSREEPFGHAGERLHEWMFLTRWWHETSGEPGDSRGIDDALLRLHEPGVGAEHEQLHATTGADDRRGGSAHRHGHERSLGEEPIDS